MTLHITEEMLSAYANDELAPEQKKPVGEHLEGCTECREKLAELRQVRLRMESLREVPDAPDIVSTLIPGIKSGAVLRKSSGPWKRRFMVLVPAAVVIVALLLVHPWSSPLGPQAVLAKAQSAISAVKSYRFSLITTNYVDNTTSSHEIAFSSPDRYHVKKTGEGESSEYILIGDDLYYKGSFGQGPVNIQITAGYYSNMITREATMRWMEMLGDIVVLPEEDIEGVRCLHIRGLRDAEKILLAHQRDMMEMGFPPRSDEEFQKQVEEYRSMMGESTMELWIGKDDYLVRQVRMDTQKEGYHSASLYKYYDFNEPVSIEPPVDDSGQLLPGWISTVPETPAFSGNVSASIDNTDPANRRIIYSANITNISGEKLADVEIMVLPIAGNIRIGYTVQSGITGQGNHEITPGTLLQYKIMYFYDATSTPPASVAEAIGNSGLYIGYVTEDGRNKIEIIHFKVPDTIFTMSADLPLSFSSIPVGEYRIDESSATSAGPAVSGEIGGKRYLFVPVGTQNSDVYAPPGILILNIEDPTHPVKVAYIQSPEGIRYLGTPAFSGTVLYVPAEGQIWIIDVTDPAAPHELAQLSGVQTISVVASGNYVYANDANRRIITINAADPSHPRIVGSLEMASGTGVTLALSDGYLLTEVDNKLLTIDISSPEALKIVNSYKFTMPDGSAAHAGNRATAGNYLYVSLMGENVPDGMAVLDVSDTVSPRQVAFLEVEGRRLWGNLLVSGSRAYLHTRLDYAISGNRERIEIIDISDPAAPAWLGYGTLPEYWTFFENASGGSSQSYHLLDGYLYWFIGNHPNHPVIEIFDLSAL